MRRLFLILLCLLPFLPTPVVASSGPKPPPLQCPPAGGTSTVNIDVGPYFDDDYPWLRKSWDALSYRHASSVSVGDINGDGVPDVVTLDTNDSSAGIITVYFGAKQLQERHHPMWIVGSLDFCNIVSAAAIGDFNGDGVGDVAVGCGIMGIPALFVVYGRRHFHGPDNMNPITITLERGCPPSIAFAMTRLYMPLTVPSAPISVTGGDVNNDTLADLIVGFPTYRRGSFSWDNESGFGHSEQENVGSVMVVYGSADPNRTRTHLTPLSRFTVEAPPGPHHWFGDRVAYLGDVNGDGVGDFATSSSSGDDGAVHVVYGAANFRTAPVRASLVIQGPLGLSMQAGTSIGSSYGKAGDFDGDGIGDIFIGYLPSVENAEGGAFVIYGGGDPEITNLDLGDMPSSRCLRYSSYPSYGDSLGASVFGGADINGDGLADLLVGAPGTKDWRGAVHVIYGQGKRNPSHNWITSADVVVRGVTGSRAGTALAAADVNGDGIVELVVGGSSGIQIGGVCSRACPTGFLLAAGGVCTRVCQPGFALESTGDCTPCPDGSVPAARSTAWGAADSCVWCPAGTFSSSEDAAKFGVDGVCRPCPAGMYSTPNETETLASCRACPAGTFAAEQGSGSCEPCPAGTFSNATGLSTVQGCERSVFFLPTALVFFRLSFSQSIAGAPTMA